MASIIVNLCDQHMEAGEEVRGDGWKFEILPPGEKRKSYSIDLCPECAKPLAALMEHFDQIARVETRGAGRSPAPPAEGEEALECPLCHEEYASRSNLGGHARRSHGMSISELLGENLRYQCLRGCEPVPKFGTGTGFAAHLRMVHELPAGTPRLPGEDLAEPAADEQLAM